MLWSLVKIVLFVCAVAVAALGAGFLLEAEGGLRIELAGSEYTLAPLQSVIALIVLVFTVWLFLKLLGLLIAAWHFLNGDETALSRYFEKSRQAKGYDALSEGMMALASGDGRTAMAKAAKAEKFLKKPELTTLLTAQAAELAGDRKKAEQSYRKLVEVNATRFVGVNGLMKQKLDAGDTDTALKLAERAFAIKPKHEEVQDTLLRVWSRMAMSLEGGTDATPIDDLRAYAFATLRHRAFRRGSFAPPADVEAEDIVAPRGSDGVTRIACAEALEALDALPHDQQVLLRLRAMDGLSYADIARKTGLPLGTVTSRLARGRAAMRVALDLPPGAPVTDLLGGV